MADEVQGTAQPKLPVKVSEAQTYLQSVLDRFNVNPEDPTLSVAERVLMKKIAEAQKNISEKIQEVNKLNQEAQGLTQQVVHLQGHSQGLLDSLLALRPTSEV